MSRALCIILDSLGCGHAPDAAAFGDSGADTLGHLFARSSGLVLPHLASLGLYEILRSLDPSFPLSSPPLLQNADFTHMAETSLGKDTTTGHWEIAGAILPEAFDTFEKFPDDLIAELSLAAGTPFLGNLSASGTEIIARLGEEHLRSGRPILYTSADSVLQIAAHEDPQIFGLERLQQLCLDARRILDRRGLRIGRVIARPFIGENAANFIRTSNRHDYSYPPPKTIFNGLQDLGIPTTGVGKISDIFASSGISYSHPTASNTQGMVTIEQLWQDHRQGLIFVNLVDFDMHFGHQRDPVGYANCLREFDAWLGRFLPKIGADLLLITADHGNDPYHAGSDHTREQVPLLSLNSPAPLIPSPDFTQVAQLLSKYFQLDK